MGRLQYKAPQNVPPKEMRLSNLAGGLNLKYFDSLIRENQSPLIQNLNTDDRGSLRKRKGWTSLYANSLASDVNGIAYYKSAYVFASGTKLYKLLLTAGSTPTEVYSGLTDTAMNFFEFNGILYCINGAEFIQFDGSTAGAITPYIPTTYVNRLYSGGGDAYENINMLGAGFSNTFNGDGSHTTFLLSSIGLDATTVTCTIGGATKTENTHFTVSRVNGTVDFAAGTTPHGAPASGTNNIIITAYKTSASNKATIAGNKYFASYGGENDTRVFLTGYGNYVFYSALLDPTYWPYNNFNRLGDPNSSCTGFSKIYDVLVVFKAKEIYSMTYLNEEGYISFPTKVLNSFIGCDIPGSIQIINDMPVFANSSKGVYALFSQTGIKEEKNVRLISDNINGTPDRPGLLNKTKNNLAACSSVDFENKYWLCVGNVVYAWDYNLTPYAGLDDGGQTLSWFYYTNINASCFTINTSTNVLVFGDRTTGMIKAFGSNLADDSTAINAIWRSKLFSFSSNGVELVDWLKNVLEIWITTRSLGGDGLVISYYTEKDSLTNNTSITSRNTKSFTWDTFDYSEFSWGVYNFVVTLHKTPKLKNVQYFQLELSNNVLSEDLSVINIIIQYALTNRIR